MENTRSARSFGVRYRLCCSKEASQDLLIIFPRIMLRKRPILKISEEYAILYVCRAQSLTHFELPIMQAIIMQGSFSAGTIFIFCSTDIIPS